MSLSEKLTVTLGLAGILGFVVAETSKEMSYFTDNYQKFEQFYNNTLLCSTGVLICAGASALYSLKSKAESEKPPRVH